MAFFIFILGLFLGSFLNVLADRLPFNKSILGRSHCEYCHKSLKPLDLIPIASFVYLHGKCRYCHHKFSIQYPISELLTGLVFALVYFATPNPLSNIPLLLLNLFVASIFISIFFADLRYRIIPDKILLPATFSVFVYLFIFQLFQLPNHLISGVICCLFFLFIFAFTRGRGMGFGDVKFAFLIGLFLGIPLSLIALYLAFLTGGAASLILILWKKKGLKSQVSFGPFLVLGTGLAFFLEGPILRLFSVYFG